MEWVKNQLLVSSATGVPPAGDVCLSEPEARTPDGAARVVRRLQYRKVRKKFATELLYQTLSSINIVYVFHNF